MNRVVLSDRFNLNILTTLPHASSSTTTLINNQNNNTFIPPSSLLHYSDKLPQHHGIARLEVEEEEEEEEEDEIEEEEEEEEGSGQFQACSQCKDEQPIERFPLRLDNLQPYAICKTHEWYWTEPRQLTWAPERVTRFSDLLQEVERRVRSTRRAKRDDSWLVVAPREDMKTIAQAIAAVGQWNLSKFPVRKSRSISLPLPPAVHAYALEPNPTAQTTSIPFSTETLRLTLTHHLDLGKFVIKLAAAKPPKVGWRKNKPGPVGKKIAAETGEEDAVVPAKIKKTGGRKRKSMDVVEESTRAEILVAGSPELGSDDEVGAAGTIHHLQELQRQLESGQRLSPPPPPRIPRRVIPKLISQPVPLPSHGLIPAYNSPDSCSTLPLPVAKRSRPSPPMPLASTSTLSLPSVDEINAYLSRDLDALIDPSLLPSQHATNAILSSASAAYPLAIDTHQLQIPTQQQRHPQRPVKSTLKKSSRVRLTSTSTATLRSPVSIARQRAESNSPNNAASSAIDTESEVSSEDDYTTDDGFASDHFDEECEEEEGEDFWLTGFVQNQLMGGRK